MNYLHFFAKRLILAACLAGTVGALPAQADTEGKLLVFWASWCSYCKAPLKQFDALSRQQALSGNTVVAVNIHDPGTEPSAFIGALNLSLPAAKADQYAAAASQVPGLPWMVLVGANGEVIASAKPMKSARANQDWVASMTRLNQSLALSLPKTDRG